MPFEETAAKLRLQELSHTEQRKVQLVADTHSTTTALSSPATIQATITWVLDQVSLDRPGNAAVQLDMLFEYRTNLPLYPAFQNYLRKYQLPP